MNPKLIGLFVIGAVALALIAVIVWGGGLFREKQKWVAFFDSSVKGLNVGAPVAFRGVKVGSVTDIQLRIDRKEAIYQIPVFFEIEPARLSLVDNHQQTGELNVNSLIDRGLRAQLAVQSFVTGLLMIELDFKPETDARIVGSIEAYPEIPAVPSDLEDFLQKFNKVPIEELLTQVTEIAENVGEVVSSPHFKNTIENLSDTLEGMNLLVRMLEENLDPFLNEGRVTLREFRQNMAGLSRKMAMLSDKLEVAVDQIHSVASVADRQLPSLMTGVEETTMSARETLEQTRVAVEAIKSEFSGSSPLMYQLHEVLSELSSASRSARVLADYLHRHPEALLRGKKNREEQ
ncbi:MAG: MlaD family protein [Desulfobacterales bacterium]